MTQAPNTLSISEMIADARIELTDAEKRAFQIETIEELLLFTPIMLSRHNSTMYRELRSKISHLALSGLNLSEEGSSMLYNVTRVFDSLNRAPIAVLHFMPAGADHFSARHEPIGMIRVLQKVSPPLTVGELVDMPTATFLSLLRDQDLHGSMVAFARRLRAWGLVSNKK